MQVHRSRHGLHADAQPAGLHGVDERRDAGEAVELAHGGANAQAQTELEDVFVMYLPERGHLA